MNKKVNFTKEFKVQACKLVLEDEIKVKTVADKMGINHIIVKSIKTPPCKGSR